LGSGMNSSDVGHDNTTSMGRATERQRDAGEAMAVGVTKADTGTPQRR
jgi:hypothetical protein